MAGVQPLARPAKKAAKKAAAKAPAKKAAAKKAPAPVAAPAPENPPPVQPTPHPEIGPDDLDHAEEVLDGEVIEPAYLAYQLRRTCMPWDQVARRCGYRTDNEAWVAVHQLLDRGAKEQAPARRAAALEQSIERHEALIHSWWDRATVMGDPQAAAVVSRELTALDRVQRLGEKDTEVGGEGRRIVIAGTPEQYVAALQQIAAEGRGEGRPVPELEAQVGGDRVVDVVPA